MPAKLSGKPGEVKVYPYAARDQGWPPINGLLGVLMIAGHEVSLLFSIYLHDTTAP